MEVITYGDFIVFVDESGDHNLEIINSQYPVFVLAFCVFRKSDYVNVVCPAVQQFKLDWFGHDASILHEREIRKYLAPFNFLKSRAIKDDFMGQLTAIIEAVPVKIIQQ